MTDTLGGLLGGSLSASLENYPDMRTAFLPACLPFFLFLFLFLFFFLSFIRCFVCLFLAVLMVCRDSWASDQTRSHSSTNAESKRNQRLQELHAFSAFLSKWNADDKAVKKIRL